MENLQINDLDEKFIKALQKKKICLVILGQNALAQSILVNELLGRYLLPFEINTALKEENWRFVRIKVAYNYLRSCHSKRVFNFEIRSTRKLEAILINWSSPSSK